MDIFINICCSLPVLQVIHASPVHASMVPSVHRLLVEPLCHTSVFVYKDLQEQDVK